MDCAPPETAAEVYRCSAWPAWAEGRWLEALVQSQAALARDPAYAPARLMHGLALLRVHRVREGVEELRVLQDDPHVGWLAGRAVTVNEGRWSRKGLAVGLGVSAPAQWAPIVLAEVGLTDAWGLRATWVPMWDGDADEPDLSGSTLGLAVARGWIAGTWRADVGAGPLVFHGDRRLPDNDGVPQTLAGGRVAVGLDVRPMRWTLPRLEAGYDLVAGTCGSEACTAGHASVRFVALLTP
ncbi:MAG: hypothetical protein ACOZNI_22115 [Myxococcota bacterium]